MSAGPFSEKVAMPRAEECVLPRMLDSKAALHPERPLVVFDRGPTWTYSEARHLARGTASSLERLGVGRHDRVLIFLPDGPIIVRLHLALAYIGAVYVPINTALKGSLLQHIINSSESSLLIVHQTLVRRLEGLDIEHVKKIVIVGHEAPSLGIAGYECFTDDALAPTGVEPKQPVPELEPWDVHAIFYTSGTTGPSKGVTCTHVHTWYMAVGGLPFLRESDRFMSPSAYFHIAGAYVPWAAIFHGASMAIVGEFRSREFWSQIQRTHTTATIVIGAMADFLLKGPPQADEHNHQLRIINQQPLAHDAAAFARRFNVKLYTQFDSTELGPALASEVFDGHQSFPPGYCGRVRDGFEVRLVDSNDQEVPIGQIGEYTVRSELPWIITPAYFGMPEATTAAWRNGWFHTGDAFRCDEAGNYYFVDRIKDTIRRRGENISSMEVEQEILAYPEVSAVAAYGVPSEHGEDEVMVTIEPKMGKTIDPFQLLEFLVVRVAHFMVPRYVRFIQKLPRSATDKIQKAELRSEGVTADTWDRVVAGFQIKRTTVP